MKVHHILSETLDVKQINGMWRVFDTVKNSVVGDIGFSSPGEAEAERDKLRSNRAKTSGRRPAPVATRGGTVPATATAPDVLKPDADEIRGSTKLRRGAIGTAKVAVKSVSMGVAAAVGGSVLAFINFLEVRSLLEDYGKALDQANGDVTAAPVIYTKTELMRGIIEGTTSVFTAAASGAMSAAYFSRGLAFIPFTGWIASLIVGSISGIAAYVITRLAKDAAFLKSIAEFMMRKIDSKLILQYSEGTNENTAGAENNIKQVMKAAIKSDPKMIAAFKQAKANKAKSTAS